MEKTKFDIATLGGGCFWCMEAIFKQLDGVVTVHSGYAGGDMASAHYTEVCSGITEHAEVVQIKFIASSISYQQLLAVFFASHDPTSVNQQGEDVGKQYRSVIFTHNENQQRIAEEMLQSLDKSQLWSAPLVTDINPYEDFFLAEDIHHDYFANHQHTGYCRLVIAPKVEQIKAKFADLIK